MDASSQYVWNIRFISEIEKRPGIWNQSIKTRYLQKRLWDELSTLYNNKSVESLKRKYNNLKVKFRQQLSLIPQTNNRYDVDPQSFESDWPHYEQMLFLLNGEVKKNGKIQSSTTEQSTVAKGKRNGHVLDDVDVNGNDLDSSTTGVIEQLKIERPSDIRVRPDIYPSPPAEDGLYHFLMGLYDSMNELDPIRKLKVQAQMYAILSQEVAASAAAAN